MGIRRHVAPLSQPRFTAADADIGTHPSSFSAVESLPSGSDGVPGVARACHKARMTATASQKPLVCTWCRDWVLASPIPKFQENSAVSKLGKTRPGSGVPWSETSAEVEVDASGFRRLLSQIRSEQRPTGGSHTSHNHHSQPVMRGFPMAAIADFRLCEDWAAS